MNIRAPFPWFGGKRQVVDVVWSRFGDVPNYVEPFCGSMAMCLSRPHYPWEGHRIETVNDADGFVANFWRAIKTDPDSVAEHADWPVSEPDLHARHLWLIEVGREHVEKLKTDPDYFDPKIAGWWVWGLCQWIGSGWYSEISSKLPHIGSAGRGVNRPSQQLPHLGDAGSELHAYFVMISERLRRVRVCCGDWSRVCGPTPTTRQGLTAVFLDPPYADTANRTSDIYAIDSLSVAHEVRKWAIENGTDTDFRIALCGYEGEHEMPDDWECVAWKAKGGYGSQGDGDGRENAARERIWFSPHCLKPLKYRSLFSEVTT